MAEWLRLCANNHMVSHAKFGGSSPDCALSEKGLPVFLPTVGGSAGLQVSG